MPLGQIALQSTPILTCWLFIESLFCLSLWRDTLPNEYVTEVMFVFGVVPANFRQVDHGNYPLSDEDLRTLQALAPDGVKHFSVARTAGHLYTHSHI